MRDQITTRNKSQVIPEKFADTSSFYSFLVQSENCCEINDWEEREKLLMLRNSLTGSAAATCGIQVQTNNAVIPNWFSF